MCNSRRHVSAALLAVVACACSDNAPTSANGTPIVGAISVAPLINESHAALMGATNLTFSVAGASDPDGDALTYAWNFGDGVTAQGPEPTHRYDVGGAFTARVTVTDSKGASTTATRTVRVATLNGVWDGEITRIPGSMLGADRFTLVVTHSGAAITGVWSDNGGATNRFAPGFLTHPFRVSFSCESCPSNGGNDLSVRGDVVTSLGTPAGPGFDVYNMVSGTCSSCSWSSFGMRRR